MLTPLDEASVATRPPRCRALGAEAVAVCLLHAFANPDHERRAASCCARRCPASP